MPYGRKRSYRSVFGRRRRFPRIYKRRRIGGYGTRRSYGRRSMRMYKKPSGVSTILPKSIFTKVKFQQYGALNTGGASAWTSTTFRMNGPYDPLYAVGGGQCSGFPELAAIYGTYRVYGCKISIRGYNTCATPSIFWVNTRTPNEVPIASAADALNRVLEYGKFFRYRMLSPNVTGANVEKFNLNWYNSMKAIWGKQALVDSDFESATTTTPVNQSYYDVGLVSLDGTTVNVSVNFLVVITYYVKFSDLLVNYS